MNKFGLGSKILTGSVWVLYAYKYAFKPKIVISISKLN